MRKGSPPQSPLINDFAVARDGGGRVATKTCRIESQASGVLHGGLSGCGLRRPGYALAYKDDNRR
jgi:hypothetical protein